MKILRFTDLTEVPWKNGGGMTRNIAIGKMGNQTAWRLSRADVVQDGAFSEFAGLVRILTVVSNSGMVLEHAEGVLDADPLTPVRFDGGLKIYSRLKSGPLSDLNLMFSPSFCDGNVITRRGPYEQELALPKNGIVALHVLSGNLIISGTHLATGDTAFVDTRNAPFSLAQGDAVLEIRLSYLVQSDAIKLCIADL
jgi:environmental stress-induced protein Ves